MQIKNLFSNIPETIPNEIFEDLLVNDNLKIERILSLGQATPQDTWFDQDRDEWVVLLQGRARLKFVGESISVDMRPGDYLFIPAHKKHRVEWTDPQKVSIWLALHF
ncbi:MAG: cupin domain-containing protein [bacterium]